MSAWLHPCVFLIGRHGSGKTSIGRALESDHGWFHVSLGDLGRLARKGRLPDGYSLRLMTMMAGHVPGHPLRLALVHTLLADVQSHRAARNVSVDGFPSEPAHLALLPPNSIVVLVDVPDELREQRLLDRAATSKRNWTPGMDSPRDIALPDLIQAAAAAGVLRTVSNTGNLARAVAAVRELAGEKKPPG